MNAKKIVAALLAVVLLIGIGVGGTLAWLTATTGAVTNTFTVGKIEIDLKEHGLGSDGELTTELVTSNDNYKVVPGKTQPKDPFVTVKAGSEDCYVFVLVTNNLVIDGVTVATYDIDSSWQECETRGNSTLYLYNTQVTQVTSDEKLQVFTTVTYNGEKITKDNISTLADKTIEIRAYAHQVDPDQSTAIAAAKAYFFPSST